MLTLQRSGAEYSPARQTTTLSQSRYADDGIASASTPRFICLLACLLTCMPAFCVRLCRQELRQVYKGGKVAVKGLSFGIPIGQCFGFLGINGAGKTSSLKVLGGELVPTSGSAMIAGFDVITEQMKIRKLLGSVAHVACTRCSLQQRFLAPFVCSCVCVYACVVCVCVVCVRVCEGPLLPPQPFSLTSHAFHTNLNCVSQILSAVRRALSAVDGA